MSTQKQQKKTFAIQQTMMLAYVYAAWQTNLIKMLEQRPKIENSLSSTAKMMMAMMMF